MCLLLQTFLKAVQQFVKEVQAGGPLAKDAKNEKGDAAAAAPSAAAKPSAAKKAEVRGGFCRASCAHQHVLLAMMLAFARQACLACSAERDEMGWGDRQSTDSRDPDPAQ